MSGVPYFPFYPADYMADTSHLTTEQHGIYLLLLLAAWGRGGRLPNDPKKLARCARVSLRRWHLLAEDVLEFWTVDGDEIVSERLEREHKKAVSKSEKRSASGKRGAVAKALKKNEAAQANAKQTLQHSPEPEPLVTSVTKEEARKRAARLPENWTLPAEWIEDATAVGLTVEQAYDQAERMRDWSRSAAKGARREWRAVWRNWCKRVADERAKPGGIGNHADRQRASADAHQSASLRLIAKHMGNGSDGESFGSEAGSGDPFAVADPGGHADSSSPDRAPFAALPTPNAKRA